MKALLGVAAELALLWLASREKASLRLDGGRLLRLAAEHCGTPGA